MLEAATWSGTLAMSATIRALQGRIVADLRREVLGDRGACRRVIGAAERSDQTVGGTRGLGGGDDRRGVDHHDRERQIRVPGGELEDDGRAHAVPDDDGPGQAGVRAQPGDVVGEAGDRVVLVGGVALAVPAEVDREDPVALPEVFELGREVRVVAGPAVDEDERRISRPGFPVEELGPVPLEERHHRPPRDAYRISPNLTEAS